MHLVAGQKIVVLNMARLMTEPSSAGVDVAPSPTRSATPLRTGTFTCEPKRPPSFPLTSCNYATKQVLCDVFSSAAATNLLYPPVLNSNGACRCKGRIYWKHPTRAPRCGACARGCNPGSCKPRKPPHLTCIDEAGICA
jgi:hypothetical protein